MHLSCNNAGGGTGRTGGIVRFAAVLSALILLTLSVAYYSPLHKHYAWNSGSCALCVFAHLGAETPDTGVQLPAPAQNPWHGCGSALPAPPEAAGLTWFGRAPPASFLTSPVPLIAA